MISTLRSAFTVYNHKAPLMFSKLFKRSTTPVKSLEHPKDLQKGDMLQLVDSFALPPELKGQTLHVIDINTYQHEYQNDTELVLKGDSGTSLFLTIDTEDGEEWATFNLKIQRNQVEQLFDMDQFADIFDSDQLTELTRINTIEQFNRWTTEHYIQNAQPSTAYFYNQDFRGQSISKYVEDGGEPCECISLSDANDNFAINIEIWENGETDVFLAISRPLTDIVDLFPGQ